MSRSSIAAKRKRGQSLFEVVIAIAVVTMILVSLVSLASLSIKNTTFSKNRTSATRYAQETVEWLRGERDAGWNQFFSRVATGIWCMPDLDWNSAQIGKCSQTNYISGTKFIREVTLSSSGVDSVSSVIVVSWVDGQGSHESRTSTTFTNWKN